LWKRGLRYRLNVAALPGRPDIVFVRERVVVFCDGDFWHGRNLVERIAKLNQGHNASYWVAKVQANVARDDRQTRALEAEGWRVVRLWETEIARDVEAAAEVVATAVKPEANKR
jgi:DNA mismatch endonuclease, patch repair protein